MFKRNITHGKIISLSNLVEIVTALITIFNNLNIFTLIIQTSIDKPGISDYREKDH